MINIKSKAFYECKKLLNITIPSNVTIIGASAFTKCSSLKKITIPEKVTSIGKQAFCKCSKLKTVTIKTTKLTATKIGTKAFSDIHKKAIIKVPKNKWKNYKKMLKQKGVSSTVTIKK